MTTVSDGSGDVLPHGKNLPADHLDRRLLLALELCRRDGLTWGGLDVSARDTYMDAASAAILVMSRGQNRSLLLPKPALWQMRHVGGGAEPWKECDPEVGAEIYACPNHTNEHGWQSRPLWGEDSFFGASASLSSEQLDAIQQVIRTFNARPVYADLVAVLQSILTDRGLQ